MLTLPGYLASAGAWLWVKIALAIMLGWVHWQMTRWRDDFAADRNSRPQKFFRVMNEVPTLLMIGIVILVVIRPF
jgi:putative membrane protein